MSSLNSIQLKSNSKIKINFNVGDLFSDSGLLLIKEYAYKFGFDKHIIQFQTDKYDNDLIEHKIIGLIIIMLIGVISTWIIGGILVFKNEMTAGEVILITNYLNLLFSHTQLIATFTNEFLTANTAINRIYEYLNFENEEVGGNIVDRVGKIYFKDLEFSYGHKVILSDCSITFEAGKIYGITGCSGSGKSTIVKLLLKIVSPQKGDLFVNNINMTEIDINSYRENIGYVSTSSKFFVDRIYSNLCLDNFHSKFEVEEMMKKCCIYKEVSELESNTNTVIQQKHNNFSEGQARRLDMTRALLKKPSLIILDEAMSCIDKEKKEQIMNNIKINKKELITIIISHNDSDLEFYDVVYSIENGRLRQI